MCAHTTPQTHNYYDWSWKKTKMKYDWMSLDESEGIYQRLWNHFILSEPKRYLDSFRSNENNVENSLVIHKHITSNILIIAIYQIK